MKRIALAALMVLGCLTAFQPALAAESGNLLHGTLYKQSGMARKGFITIRTSWKLPGEAPVFRYDFDVLHGTTEGNLYSFMMADIAEIAFLPMEEGSQPVNVKLRTGLVQKIYLTSDAKGILGKVNLHLAQVDLLTDSFGENVVSGGDVEKIVFSKPPATGEETMSSLVDTFDKALIEGKRDGLVDGNLMVILRTLQTKMKDRLKE